MTSLFKSSPGLHLPPPFSMSFHPSPLQVDISRVFQQIDVDDSGTVSSKEFKRALKCLGLSTEQEEIAKMLEDMKAIEDGGSGRGNESNRGCWVR